jgi:hypothetical protein
MLMRAFCKGLFCLGKAVNFLKLLIVDFLIFPSKTPTTVSKYMRNSEDSLSLQRRVLYMRNSEDSLSLQRRVLSSGA